MFLFVCVLNMGASLPRVLLSGNGCGTVWVRVGGRPCGLSADGGMVVAFVSLLLPLGLQIDVLFLGSVLWQAKGSPLKRSDTYYCLLNSM